MYHFEKDLVELTDFARVHHSKERRITLESIYLVGELENRKAWFAMRMSMESFAKHIGLTINKYRKRLAAWRVVRSFPQAEQMFVDGEIDVSHLALIAGRITQKNEDALLEGIRGTSKREAEDFVSRMDHNGNLHEKEPVTEFTVRLTESEFKIFERAREILAHGGHVPTNAEIIKAATAALVDRRDPMRKAERAEARRGRKKAVQDLSAQEPISSPETKTETAERSHGKNPRGREKESSRSRSARGVETR